MFRGLKKLVIGSNGAISHTKLWNNIGNITATIIISYQAYLGTLSDELLIIYLAVVSGSATASKILTNRMKLKEEAQRPRDDNY